MPRYIKPYLSPQQQVALLLQRGMTITDVPRAEDCLARIGYYRLSAYWYPFRESEHIVGLDGRPQRRTLDNFRPGTDFSTVHELYVFDKKLRLIVLDALERIEIAVRTQIALTLGAVGPFAHRDPKFLHGNFTKKPHRPGSLDTKFQVWLRMADDKFASSKEDFANHFRSKYPQDNPPIWIAVEAWDFGAMSHFYAGMRQVDKEQIAQTYKLSSCDSFESWIRCLNDVRNLCAHHSRLWNRALVNNPRLPKVSDLPAIDHLRENVQYQSRIYAALCILQHLLSIINPSTVWKDRLIAHIATLPVNAFVTLHSAGFPPNWTTLPHWVTPD